VSARRLAGLAVGAILLVGLTAGAHAETPVKRFALVVGNNAAPHAGLATLRYADDDAVRWTLLLQTFGTEVALLTDLDAQSERLYGAAAPAHRSASVTELDAAMKRLGEGMRQAHAAGARTAFFFVYAGHGDVDADGDGKAGEGYVALGQTHFSRSDLERHVLAVSPADTNHVIVDACRSLYLAADRGPGGSRRAWPEPYFDASAAARFPNTGFLLSSSSGGASHEWEEFQAGIFSHEVRSGLLGGADANGDGQITYRELAAFVHVANKAVRNESYRPEILAQPPRAGDGVLMTLSEARAGRIHFGKGQAGRHVLEDELGIRWADVHPGATQDVTLAMPAAWGDGQTLFLRTPADDREVRLTRGADAYLAALPGGKSTVTRRGALHEAFALLFSVPFDDAAANAEPLFVTRDAPLSCDAPLPLPCDDAALGPPRMLRPLAISATAGAAVAGLAAGVIAWKTSSFADSANATLATKTGDERAGVNAGIERGNRWTLATGVTSAVFAATAVGLWLWDHHARSASRER
jgi:hypothetical protein